MAKLRVVDGKLLVVGGDLVVNDDCCCECCDYLDEIIVGDEGSSCFFAGTTLTRTGNTWSGVFFGCGDTVELILTGAITWELKVGGVSVAGPADVPCGDTWGILTFGDVCGCGANTISVTVYPQGVLC